ncbi:MAG: hypothetical protein WCS69_16290 [Ignavibacteriaceae bacterium]|jgi:hypothetical protein
MHNIKKAIEELRLTGLDVLKYYILLWNYPRLDNEEDCKSWWDDNRIRTLSCTPIVHGNNTPWGYVISATGSLPRGSIFWRPNQLPFQTVDLCRGEIPKDTVSWEIHELLETLVKDPDYASFFKSVEDAVNTF